MIEKNHPWLWFFRFSICSNGLLYHTPKVQEFFKKYSKWVSFSISIDGNKELHDQCRFDLSGNGTYDRAISSALSYKNLYGELPSTKMTLSPNNISYTYDALINLMELGYKLIPFNCIFEEGWNHFHATILYKELIKVADYLITNNLYNKVNIKMFNEDNFAKMDESDN
jgi:sulfatase maturation enzyme AslB (radical SAM superfamily)